MASSAGMRRKVASTAAVTTSPYFTTASPAKKPRAHVQVKVEKPTSPKRMKSETKPCGDVASGWKPVLFEEHYSMIREMRKDRDAPVDSMGAECCQDESAPPNVRRFQALVSLLLSSMTKDETTAAAMRKLRDHGLTVPNILVTSEADVGKLIYPVGFWKTKASNLKKVAAILRDQFDDDIPSSVPALVSLPGIGPKMAHLCMLIAWDEVTGIGVDTHVHRISNRLRWVAAPTRTPEGTRKALEAWLPREYWRTINLDIVGFGQTRCLPVGPRCDGCLLNDTCPKVGVSKKVKKEPKR